jgi:hypothetical protein
MEQQREQGSITGNSIVMIRAVVYPSPLSIAQ